MHPGVAVIFGSEGDDGMRVTVRFLAPGGVLEQAEASEDLRTAVSAIREARGCVELLGKLAGQLKDSPTINVILMPEWRELQTAILKALAPHRDARLAVTTALAEMESHHAAGHA